jgi:CcmD family protein
MPALPLHEAGKYVAAAYIVVFALVLIYVAIMAARLGRIERELGELLELSEGGGSRPGGTLGGGATKPGAGDTTPGSATPGRSDPATDADAPDPLDVGRPQSTPA